MTQLKQPKYDGLKHVLTKAVKQEHTRVKRHLHRKHNHCVFKPAERLKVSTTCINLHALAEFSVRAGFILVPAVSEPALDLSHLPVQLLGQAIQMARVWILWRERAGKQIH